jgi:hypothetical protein
MVVRVRLEVLQLSSGGSGSAGRAGFNDDGRHSGPRARGVAFGVLNFVDLAGSERVEKSGSADNKTLLREAQVCCN